MVRRAAALAVLALLALGASSAFGAEDSLLGGPPACSAVVAHKESAPWRADLWVQCNYEVSELSAKPANREVRRVFPAPALFGARPTDSFACHRRSRAVGCAGRMKPLARADIRFNLDDYVCNQPPMRMTLTVFGGSGCEPGQNCPESAFTTRTPVALTGVHGSCGGR